MRNQLVQELQDQLCCFEKINAFSDIIILCVGSNKVVGDCIGPIVGQKLNKLLQNNESIHVYGDMEKTLNLKNAEPIIKKALYEYANPFIITVDSALGRQEMVKKIVVSSGEIKIGNSLGRSINYDSHINIKGVVGEYKNTIDENMETLKLVKPELVMRLSEIVVHGITTMLVSSCI